eukprot:CAMPEP_0185199196 /NCGR_PEP_ID=MMETSP1140-20130426/44611_1 /TAXON_ID=298111 /ORGANISM="Pavlova sp., Strain CCMP459" /LENGTH=45 /DNA_ID= /DNA_START= /DNA_END= /DNA_ORIENTATION=
MAAASPWWRVAALGGAAGGQRCPGGVGMPDAAPPPDHWGELAAGG